MDEQKRRKCDAVPENRCLVAASSAPRAPVTFVFDPNHKCLVSKNDPLSWVTGRGRNTKVIPRKWPDGDNWLGPPIKLWKRFPNEEEEMVQWAEHRLGYLIQSPFSVHRDLEIVDSFMVIQEASTYPPHITKNKSWTDEKILNILFPTPGSTSEPDEEDNLDSFNKYLQKYNE